MVKGIGFDLNGSDDPALVVDAPEAVRFGRAERTEVDGHGVGSGIETEAVVDAADETTADRDTLVVHADGFTERGAGKERDGERFVHGVGVRRDAGDQRRTRTHDGTKPRHESPTRRSTTR